MSTDVGALVSDNWELWTGAIERKSGAGRGGKKVRLYGIDRLRGLILDLAVRGKLVPQEAGDRPATMLVNDLLDADGLDRRKRKSHQSQHSAIAEADFPYKIPDGWAWVRFDQIAKIRAELVQSLDYPDALQIAPDIIEKGTGKLLSVRTVDEAGVRGPNSRFYAGQIIYSKIRPSLSKAVIAEFDGLCSADMYPLESQINTRFLLKTILSEPFLKQVRIAENRIKMPKLNKESLESFIVAIPPLAEQHRIVAKIDELMALCDALEAQTASALEAHQTLVETLLSTLLNATDPADLADQWARLENHFDALFTTDASIEALKQFILDLAVRGRLEVQDARDLPASESRLLVDQRKARRRSNTELSALTGKASHEVPFKIPSKWQWATLGGLARDMRYGTSKKCERDEGLTPVLRIPNVSGGKVTFDDLKYGPLTEKERSDLNLEAGDLLIIRSNGSLDIVGRFAVVPDLERDFAFAGYLIRLRPDTSWVVPRYLWLASNSGWIRKSIEAPIRHGVGLKNLNLTELESLQVPIPPLAEQRRIVAKVDALMALCESLRASVSDASNIRKQLADVIVDRTAA